MYRGTSIGGYLLAGFGLMLAAGLVIYAALVAAVFVCLVVVAWALVWAVRWAVLRLEPYPRALTDEEVEERLGYAPPHRYVDIPHR
jgi:hypothetical protein